VHDGAWLALGDGTPDKLNLLCALTSHVPLRDLLQAFPPPPLTTSSLLLGRLTSLRMGSAPLATSARVSLSSEARRPSDAARAASGTVPTVMVLATARAANLDVDEAAPEGESGRSGRKRRGGQDARFLKDSKGCLRKLIDTLCTTNFKFSRECAVDGRACIASMDSR
jgi:hypothetical protein